MTFEKPSLLSYAQARNWQRANPVRMAEVPVEYSVSLPMPTLRFGGPGYTQFAAPALRQPEQPVHNGAPDRWWVFDATDGRLKLFARTASVPIAPGQTFVAVSLPPIVGTMDEVRKKHADLDAAMQAVIEDFFASKPGDGAARQRVSNLIQEVVPSPLLPVYQAIASDFFAWLQA